MRVRDVEVGPKLTKLGESVDVEAYLTTFEHMMAAYGVDRSQWAVWEQEGRETCGAEKVLWLQAGGPRRAGLPHAEGW